MTQESAGGPEVLEHLIQRSGILRQPALDRVDFVHRTFQEYLAAREAADQGDSGLLRDMAHLDTWRETVIMAAGHGNAPFRSELLAGILDRAEREPTHRRTLTLLAAACLETVPALEPPELLSRIQARLDALIPPRSRREARSLSAVGDPLLRRVPTTLDGISAARAAALVRTVALVNGPQALKVLARYAADPRSEVQRELAEVWEYFDPDEYADRILADAPLDDGRIEVRNPALLPAVHRIRHLTRLTVTIESRFDLRRLTGLTALRELNLGWNVPRDQSDLGWLEEHVSLERLWVCIPGGSSLTPLTHLPQLSILTLGVTGMIATQPLGRLTQLTDFSLRLLGGNACDWELDFLRTLTRLTSLHIGEWRRIGPDLLAGLSNLETLWLTECGAPDGGLNRLVDALPRLRSLGINQCSWVTDLTALARLRELDSLSLWHVPVVDLSPLSDLEMLQRLTFDGCEHVYGLAAVASLPNLSDVCIYRTDAPVDLSPFANRRLTIHLYPETLVTGVEQLGRGVRIRRHGF